MLKALLVPCRRLFSPKNALSLCFKPETTVSPSLSALGTVNAFNAKWTFDCRQLQRVFVYIKTFYVDICSRIFAARVIVSLAAISVVPQRQAVQLSNCSRIGQISAIVTLGLRRPCRRRSGILIPTEQITRISGRRCRTVSPNSIKSKFGLRLARPTASKFAK